MNDRNGSTHKVGRQRHAQEESYNLHIYGRDTPSSIPLTKSFFPTFLLTQFSDEEQAKPLYTFTYLE